MDFFATFNNVGHFFAKAFKAIVKEIPKIEATKPVVEGVTAAIPGGTAVLPIEDAAYAVLGAVAGALNAGEAAVEKKLLDAGLDQTAIDKAKSVIASLPHITALAKSL